MPHGGREQNDGIALMAKCKYINISTKIGGIPSVKVFVGHGVMRMLQLRFTIIYRLLKNFTGNKKLYFIKS